MTNNYHLEISGKRRCGGNIIINNEIPKTIPVADYAGYIMKNFKPDVIKSKSLNRNGQKKNIQNIQSGFLNCLWHIDSSNKYRRISP